GGSALVSKKLSSIIIPHIEFRDATIREAVDVLREQAAENDTGPEAQRGVNIVLRLVPIGQIAPPSVPVAPAEGAGSPAAAGGGGQTAGATTGVREAPPVATDVIEKEAVSFQTASGTGTGAGASSQANLLQGTASTRQTLLNDRQLVGRADAITMLKSMGVSFPPGASATFWPHSGTLIVRNTQDNLDMVYALVDQANSSAPQQVSIESKFVEFNQNNLKE